MSITLYTTENNAKWVNFTVYKLHFQWSCFLKKKDHFDLENSQNWLGSVTRQEEGVLMFSCRGWRAILRPSLNFGLPVSAVKAKQSVKPVGVYSRVLGSSVSCEWSWLVREQSVLLSWYDTNLTALQLNSMLFQKQDLMLVVLIH